MIKCSQATIAFIEHAINDASISIDGLCKFYNKRSVINQQIPTVWCVEGVRYSNPLELTTATPMFSCELITNFCTCRMYCTCAVCVPLHLSPYKSAHQPIHYSRGKSAVAMQCCGDTYQQFIAVILRELNISLAGRRNAYRDCYMRDIRRWMDVQWKTTTLRPREPEPLQLPQVGRTTTSTGRQGSRNH